MHREGGRDIIIGFALFNKSPSSRGLFSSKIISFCAIQCFSGTRLSPLNFSLLRFLRRLICRTPKVPFSFPLLLFVRVSFNPRSRSSFSFPYLCLSFTAHPLHQLPLPLSLRYVSSVISTSASRGNSLSARRVPSHPLLSLPSNDVSRRLSLFFRVWQPFVPHPPVIHRCFFPLERAAIPATNFDHKLSTI